MGVCAWLSVNMVAEGSAARERMLVPPEDDASLCVGGKKSIKNESYDRGNQPDNAVLDGQRSEQTGKSREIGAGR